MKALLQAEMYMIFRQKRTYYGLGAILIIELFIIAGSWYQGNEIIGVLLESLTQSFYLKGNLLNGHLVLYIVLNSLWFNLPLIIMMANQSGLNEPLSTDLPASFGFQINRLCYCRDQLS